MAQGQLAPEAEAETEDVDTMTFLIFYQFVPESVKIYRITTDDIFVQKKLRKCHGQYVGMTGIDPAIEKYLMEIENVDGMEELYDDTAEKSAIRLETRIDEIIVCGAML